MTTTKKKRKLPATKVAASIHLHRPCDYTAKGMREIIAWAERVLRDVAAHRAKGEMGPTFRARYYYA